MIFSLHFCVPNSVLVWAFSILSGSSPYHSDWHSGVPVSVYQYILHVSRQVSAEVGTNAVTARWWHRLQDTKPINAKYIAHCVDALYARGCVVSFEQHRFNSVRYSGRSSESVDKFLPALAAPVHSRYPELVESFLCSSLWSTRHRQGAKCLFLLLPLSRDLVATSQCRDLLWWPEWHLRFFKDAGLKKCDLTFCCLSVSILALVRWSVCFRTSFAFPMKAGKTTLFTAVGLLLSRIKLPF